MLGVEGLEDLVLQSATLTLADMQKSILDGVAAWRHGPRADDVSLVIAEVRQLRVQARILFSSVSITAWLDSRLFVEVTSPGSNYSRKRTIFMLDSANLAR
jgi:hypothetical protein